MPGGGDSPHWTHHIGEPGRGARALKYCMRPGGPCPQARLFLPPSHTAPLFPDPSSYGLNSFIADKTSHSITREERLENANAYLGRAEGGRGFQARKCEIFSS